MQNIDNHSSYIKINKVNLIRNYQANLKVFHGKSGTCSEYKLKSYMGIQNSVSQSFVV